jgi:hypothetical protein
MYVPQRPIGHAPSVIGAPWFTGSPGHNRDTWQDFNCPMALLLPNGRCRSFCNHGVEGRSIVTDSEHLKGGSDAGIFLSNHSRGAHREIKNHYVLESGGVLELQPTNVVWSAQGKC